MSAALAQAVAEAARNPDAHPDLTLTYDRGHELSGFTHFEARADGRYALTADNPRRGTSVEREGTLDPEQRAALFGAVQETRLLDQPSSTRRIGDDEQPIDVVVGHAGEEHRLTLWAKDATANPDFTRFETALRALIGTLSAG